MRRIAYPLALIDRDRTIDCGSGDDRAIIDGDLDPDPRHCERIASR